VRVKGLESLKITKPKTKPELGNEHWRALQREYVEYTKESIAGLILERYYNSDASIRQLLFRFQSNGSNGPGLTVTICGSCCANFYFHLESGSGLSQCNNLMRRTIRLGY
jgi:hypothetical protein